MDTDLSLLGQQVPDISETDFERAFGEPISTTLDIDQWRSGEDLAGVTGRLEREIEDARLAETDVRRTIRKEIFPRIKTWENAPKGKDLAGVWVAKPEEVDSALRGYLFAGNVEAADGTSKLIDTLPVTIAQVGVCTTTYRGDQGEWGHRMYRRDFRGKSGDDIADMIALLEARRNRTGFEKSSRRDGFSDLLRRAFMTWAERAVLTRKCHAEWRMGHGNPLAYELLTGSGLAALIAPSIALLSELVLHHKKFVFVPSSMSDRLIATIASALKPLEYAIVSDSRAYLNRVLDGGFRGTTSGYEQAKNVLTAFIASVQEEVVVGAYRVSNIGPAHIFYAHREFAHQAAIIAMADGALLEHRGFPMLIDLADALCRAMFHGETLAAATNLAFIDAGATLDFATERMTR